MSQSETERAQAGRSSQGRRRGRNAAAAKRKPSLNACTHLLRTKTIPLPHEERVFAQLGDEWNAFIKPRTPAERHLTNDCIRADLTSMRCDQYCQAQLEQQAEDSKRKFEARRRRRLSTARGKLHADPAAVYEELRSFAHGLRWLIGRFEAFRQSVERRGYLNDDELNELIRLNGVRPYMGHEISWDVEAYTITIQNLAATPGADRAVLADWLKPENRPCALRATPAAALVGDNPRAALLQRLTAEIDHLRPREKHLRTTIDDPDRERAMKRESILNIKAIARMNRSHAESRITFHRAWKTLQELRGDQPADDDEATRPTRITTLSRKPFPPPPRPRKPPCTPFYQTNRQTARLK